MQQDGDDDMVGIFTFKVQNLGKYWFKKKNSCICGIRSVHAESQTLHPCVVNLLPLSFILCFHPSA